VTTSKELKKPIILLLSFIAFLNLLKIGSIFTIQNNVILLFQNLIDFILGIIILYIVAKFDLLIEKRYRLLQIFFWVVFFYSIAVIIISVFTRQAQLINGVMGLVVNIFILLYVISSTKKLYMINNIQRISNTEREIATEEPFITLRSILLLIIL
jgi:hypothetical protein